MTGGLERVARAIWPLAAVLGPFVLVSLLIAGASEDLESPVIAALINLIIVVGLYVFIGNSGVLSFGHISFMAIGAYAVALLTISEVGKGLLLPDLPGFLATAELATFPALLVGAAVAGVVGLVVSIPLMRLSGIAASIATLSLLVITQVVLQNWDAVTGGSGTLTGIPTDTTLGSALIWACVACAIAYAFQSSRRGLRLRATREDEHAARSVGIRIDRERWVAFTLSAMMIAIGGGLYGHFVGSLSPSAMFLQLTFITLAMLVVGGIGSLAGAVVGTAVISFITELLARMEAGQLGAISIPVRPGVREIVIALLTMLILVLRPSGITGGREVPWPGRRRRASGGHPPKSTKSAEELTPTA